MKTQEKFILFGHTGFIGKNIKEKIERRDAELHCFSSEQVDLTIPAGPEEIAHLFDAHTTVIFCAAIKRQAGDTLSHFNKNIQMVINICNILNKRPVKYFVYISSTAVYGEDVPHEMISEETPATPTSYYGISKLVSELILKKQFTMFPGSHLLVLRPPSVYGMGEDTPSYGPSAFMESALKDKRVKMWGDGSEYREFLFVNDMVDILFDLVKQQAHGVFNLASGLSCSFKDIVNMISEIFEEDIEIQSNLRSKEKVDVYFDNRKLKNCLPDFRFTTVMEGLCILYQNIKKE